MTRSLTIVATTLLGLAAATPAFAHAHLRTAVPAVGATVKSPPREIQITFTENIVIAFSGVTLAPQGGKAIALGKALLGPANTLHARIPHPLKAGTYIVSWHAVATDTHRTHGTYKFTIAP